MNDTNKPLGQPSFIQLVCQNSFGYVKNRMKDHMPAKEWEKIEKKFAKRRHSKLI
jgi:hypothetical protein